MQSSNGSDTYNHFDLLKRTAKQKRSVRRNLHVCAALSLTRIMTLHLAKLFQRLMNLKKA